MRRIAIVGGGIAGLTATYELARLAGEGAAVEAVLFEGADRFGGIIETVREGGFTVEAGPDGWVTAKPWASELAVELGLGDELVGSNDATRKTWVYLDRRLVAMPDGLHMMVPSDLGALEGSPLFGEAALAAYRAEPARADELRAAIPEGDESVAEFTMRHFGAEVLNRLAAPLLSGVFGGDVRMLSVRAVMPAFVEMEREHGSLIAALQAGRKKRVAGEAPSIFTALCSGVGTLIDRLAAAIPPHWLRLNTIVRGLQPPTADRARWTVSSASGASQPRHVESEVFDQVFLATDLEATRRFIGSLDLEAAHLLPAESSSAVLVAFCYADAARVPVPPGFGFLVPPDTGSNVANGARGDVPASLLLACTFADQKFPHRVPPGGRLIRAFFGGAAADRLALCNNDEIAAIARLELARILNAASLISVPAPPPVMTLVRRLPKSLPQYTVGHLERVADFEQRLNRLRGLTVLGNMLHGVGIPDLIRDARTAARSVVIEG
jgi:oxygen-dependent protoporphyrinogen oxidase